MVDSVYFEINYPASFATKQRSFVRGASNFVEINFRVSIRLILGSTIIDGAGYFITL